MRVSSVSTRVTHKVIHTNCDFNLNFKSRPTGFVNPGQNLCRSTLGLSIAARSQVIYGQARIGQMGNSPHIAHSTQTLESGEGELGS